MSTFLQSASASSIPCSSASLCALEVREKTSSIITILTPLCFYCISVAQTFQLNLINIINLSVLCLSAFILLTLSSSFLTVMFNFILHDRRKGPIWNIIMWTSLFLGQGVIICLYSQEWYAQRYCPLKEVTPAALCPLNTDMLFS